MIVERSNPVPQTWKLFDSCLVAILKWFRCLSRWILMPIFMHLITSKICLTFDWKRIIPDDAQNLLNSLSLWFHICISSLFLSSSFFLSVLVLTSKSFSLFVFSVTVIYAISAACFLYLCLFYSFSFRSLCFFQIFFISSPCLFFFFQISLFLSIWLLYFSFSANYVSFLFSFSVSMSFIHSSW